VIHKVLSEDIGKKCKETLGELHDIITIIERSLHIPDLAKRIDTFFYIESRLAVKRIHEKLGVGIEPDPQLAKALEDIQSRVRSRWQIDHMFISSPSSLHVYLV
jgi:hypothetical protein